LSCLNQKKEKIERLNAQREREKIQINLPAQATKVEQELKSRLSALQNVHSQFFAQEKRLNETDIRCMNDAAQIESFVEKSNDEYINPERLRELRKIYSHCFQQRQNKYNELIRLRNEFIKKRKEFHEFIVNNAQSATDLNEAISNAKNQCSQLQQDEARLQQSVHDHTPNIKE